MKNMNGEYPYDLNLSFVSFRFFFFFLNLIILLFCYFYVSFSVNGCLLGFLEFYFIFHNILFI